MLGVKDIRQAEIHTAEPLVSEPSADGVELAIDKLKSHKSPGIDQRIKILFSCHELHYITYMNKVFRVSMSCYHTRTAQLLNV